jgi:elongation factor G
MATSTDKIRNLALIGQRGSGKTILAEAMAFAAGVTNRIGSVEDGSTLSDFTEEERSHQSSLALSVLTLPWHGNKINLVDTPGHLDFIGDVLSGIAVADTVAMVINATGGVEVGTIQYHHHVEKLHKPLVFIVNKLDKENTDFEANVSALQESFGNKAVPVQLPVGKQSGITAVIDLIKMKAISFDEKGKQKVDAIPEAMQGPAEAAREKLLEVIAESNDSLLEKYFEEGTLTEDEMLAGLKEGISSGKINPVLASAVPLNVGASALLDFVGTYCPAPSEVPAIECKKPSKDEKVTVECTGNGPVLAYVFKSISEQHVGDLSYTKVLSGKLTGGLDLSNVENGSGERIGQIYTIVGKERKETDSAEAGDIVALVKLKEATTGTTLADKSRLLEFPRPEYPEPVMDVAIRAKAKGDEEKMSMSLTKQREADPTFRIVNDPALKQTLLFGQGSTQVDLLVEKLKNRYSVEVELDRPRIPYRETVTAKSEAQGKYKKQSGGRGQYGDCWLRIEPLPRGGGFEFADEIKGGVIPGKFVPSVEKGVVEAMQEGGLCGAPVVDTKVTVYFGSYHSVDSSDMAFKVAASMGFKEGYTKAKPVILEPIYNVTVIVPDEFTGDVMGDLSSRRGKVAGMDPLGRMQRIRGAVPQSELYMYSVDLRSMTQGQGFYTREFSHYEEVPYDVSEKLMAEYKSEKAHETQS